MTGHVNPYRLRLGAFPGRLLAELDTSAQGDVHRILLASSGPVSADVVCELGCGSGGHLLDVALSRPQSCCFGFELRYKRAVRTVEKALGRGIDNVYVIRADAMSCLQVFAPESLGAIFVNFPDPWQKRRDQKKRLLGPWLTVAAGTLLRPGGILSIKTDHHENFAAFRTLCRKERSLEIFRETEDLYNDAALLRDNIASEFEKLFRDQKTPICHLAARRSA